MSPLAAWNTECERRDRLIASAHSKARSGFGAELVLAADQFITDKLAILFFFFSEQFFPLKTNCEFLS